MKSFKNKHLKGLLTSICLIASLSFISNNSAIAMDNSNTSAININNKCIWEKEFSTRSVEAFAKSKNMNLFYQDEKDKDQQTLGYRFNKNSIKDIIKNVNKINPNIGNYNKNVLAIMIFNILCGQEIDFTKGIDDMAFAFDSNRSVEGDLEKLNSLQKTALKNLKRVKEELDKAQKDFDDYRIKCGDERFFYYERTRTSYRPALYRPSKEETQVEIENFIPWGKTKQGIVMTSKLNTLEKTLEKIKLRQKDLISEIDTRKRNISSPTNQYKSTSTINSNYRKEKGRQYITGFLLNDMLKHSVYFSDLNDDKEDLYTIQNSINRLWNMIKDKMTNKDMKDRFGSLCKKVIKESIIPLLFGENKVALEEVNSGEKVNSGALSFSKWGNIINNSILDNISKARPASKNCKKYLDQMNEFLSFFSKDINEYLSSIQHASEIQNDVLDVLKKIPAEDLKNKNIIVNVDDFTHKPEDVLFIDHRSFLFSKNLKFNCANVFNKLNFNCWSKYVHFGILYTKFLSLTETDFFTKIDQMTKTFQEFDKLLDDIYLCKNPSLDNDEYIKFFETLNRFSFSKFIDDTTFREAHKAIPKRNILLSACNLCKQTKEQYVDYKTFDKTFYMNKKSIMYCDKINRELLLYKAVLNNKMNDLCRVREFRVPNQSNCIYYIIPEIGESYKYGAANFVVENCSEWNYFVKTKYELEPNSNNKVVTIKMKNGEEFKLDLVYSLQQK